MPENLHRCMYYISGIKKWFMHQIVANIPEEIMKSRVRLITKGGHTSSSDGSSDEQWTITATAGDHTSISTACSAAHLHTLTSFPSVQRPPHTLQCRVWSHTHTPAEIRASLFYTAERKDTVRLAVIIVPFVEIYACDKNEDMENDK